MISSQAILLQQQPCLSCAVLSIDAWGRWLQDRVRYEADALRQQHSLCPEHVPALYHFDAQNALIVMQYLPPPHVILRKAIVQVGSVILRKATVQAWSLVFKSYCVKPLFMCGLWALSHTA